MSIALGAPMLSRSSAGSWPTGCRADLVLATVVLHASAAASLAALSLTGRLEGGHLVAFAFVHGTAFAFAVPTRQAFSRSSPDRRTSGARWREQRGLQFSRIAARVIGGALVADPFIGIAALFGS